MLPLLLFKMIAINMDELADKLAAKLLPQLTSALSDKLLAAVQPVVDRLDKLISIMSEVQPPATQSWVEPQIYSVMTKMIHMDRNELDEKNKRATEKDTKEEDEKLLREAITLSESYANGHITTKRHPDYRAGPKGYRPLKVMFESQIHRDIFLRNRFSKMQSLPHSYVGRDYTVDELKYDRISRRRAGQENQKLGVIRFVVRDLQIIQLKSDRPLSRPFPTRSISPDS
ncbi:unnamed protein product, partial [Toxocara canis]